VASRKNSQGVPRNEMFIILGFGDDVAPSTDAGKALLKLACKSGGIFTSVADSETLGDEDRFRTEARLLDALSSFSRYFQTSNAIKKTRGCQLHRNLRGRHLPHGNDNCFSGGV